VELFCPSATPFTSRIFRRTTIACTQERNSLTLTATNLVAKIPDGSNPVEEPNRSKKMRVVQAAFEAIDDSLAIPVFKPVK
jgi:hypothetical protein